MLAFRKLNIRVCCSNFLDAVHVAKVGMHVQECVIMAILYKAAVFREILFTAVQSCYVRRAFQFFDARDERRISITAK